MMMPLLAFGVRRGLKVNNALRKRRMKAGLIMMYVYEERGELEVAELNGKMR